jgi:hypothetical protein
MEVTAARTSPATKASPRIPTRANLRTQMRARARAQRRRTLTRTIAVERSIPRRTTSTNAQNPSDFIIYIHENEK